MNIEQVKQLSEFERLCYFIQERESIRLKKERGEPKPWTTDSILSSYRFCNARRMDDKVSQWLLKNWYEPYFDHPNMLVACALARHFNHPVALGHITLFVFEKYSAANIKKVLRMLKTSGQTIFNGAYMVRGIGEIDKTEMVVSRVCQPLIDTPPELNTDSMQECVEALLPYWGFSSFMAGQTISDLRWAISGKWLDKDTWAPMGPGSLKGVNYLLGRPAKQRMTQQQFLEHLSGIADRCKKALPTSITSRLEMMDYQNCMCEFRAYHQAVEGIKRPKRRYS